jgi:SAM-dependent methyltransferase
MTASATTRPLHRLEPAELLYGRLLASAAGGVEPVEARFRIADGRARKLPLHKWLAPVDGADRAVLAHARPPVLDIGCGPGRHLAALASAGHEGLGLDLSPAAVRIARARGAEAILRSVVADVPRAGTWGTALLLDGNIGIGGDPAVLLARVSQLLAPGGTVLCECDAPGTGVRRGPLRLEHGRRASDWFPWARVGVDALDDVAGAAGLRVSTRWSDGGRWFGRLEAS